MRIVYKLLWAAGLVFLLQACGGESASDHLERAKTFLAANDTASAAIELKNALQLDQNQAEARWLLGKLYLDEGDAASAEKELQRADWLDWPAEDVAPAYARALVTQGKFAETLKVEDDALSKLAQADLYTSQARARLGLGENQQAKELLDRVLAITPDDANALLTKAQLLMTLGETKDARGLIDKVLAADPDNVGAWGLLAAFHQLEQQPEEAAKAFDEILKRQPDHPAALQQRAIAALEANDLKNARQLARHLATVVPRDPIANLVLGVLDMHEQQYARAVERLTVAEPAAERYPTLWFYLAGGQLLTGKEEQAAANAARFLALVPNSSRGRTLLASIRLREADYASAEELLRPVVIDQPDNVTALRLLADALIRQNNTAEGIELLSRVAELEPDSADARLRLGLGLLLEGKASQAQESIELALQLDPQSQQADVLLVQSLVNQNKFDDAVAAATRAAAASKPDDTLMLNLLAWVYSRQGDEAKARATYEQVLAKVPGDPGANSALAGLALEKGDRKTATAYYDAILAAQPDHLATQLRLAVLEAEDGDTQAAQTRLEQLVERQPTALEPRLLLARLHLAARRQDKVAATFVGLTDAQLQDSRVLQLTAIAQLMARDHSQALFTLEQLTASRPDTPDYHYLTALAAAGNGDLALTKQELNATLALDDKHLAARLLLAKLLLREGGGDAFDEQLQALARSAPDSPDVLLLQAAAAAEQDDVRAAITFSERAYAKTPVTATVLSLGGYRSAAGETAAAQRLYQTWLEQYPEDRVVRLALADTMMAVGDDATEQYRQVLKHDENNVLALNNLAWLLREQEPAQALTYARKAAELAPQRPEVLDTLAVVELQQGNVERARAAIDRALAAGPEQPALLYHRAMIEEAGGDTAAALATLTALLEDDPEFSEVAEAKAMYSRLRR